MQPAAPQLRHVHSVVSAQAIVSATNISFFLQQAFEGLKNAGRKVRRPDCTLATTDAYLATVNIFYSHRWRNLGLLWAYIVFNVAAALGLYWLARAPKAEQKVRVSQVWASLLKVVKR